MCYLFLSRAGPKFWPAFSAIRSGASSSNFQVKFWLVLTQEHNQVKVRIFNFSPTIFKFSYWPWIRARVRILWKPYWPTLFMRNLFVRFSSKHPANFNIRTILFLFYPVKVMASIFFPDFAKLRDVFVLFSFIPLQKLAYTDSLIPFISAWLIFWIVERFVDLITV